MNINSELKRELLLFFRKNYIDQPASIVYSDDTGRILKVLTSIYCYGSKKNNRDLAGIFIDNIKGLK